MLGDGREGEGVFQCVNRLCVGVLFLCTPQLESLYNEPLCIYKKKSWFHMLGCFTWVYPQVFQILHWAIRTIFFSCPFLVMIFFFVYDDWEWWDWHELAIKCSRRVSTLWCRIPSLCLTLCLTLCVNLRLSLYVTLCLALCLSAYVSPYVSHNVLLYISRLKALSASVFISWRWIHLI